jgi:hypothetical protein
MQATRRGRLLQQLVGGLRQCLGFNSSARPFVKEDAESFGIDVIGGLASGFALIEYSNGIREGANRVSPINEGYLVDGPVELGQRYRLALSFNGKVSAAEAALHNDVGRVDIEHGEAAARKKVIANSGRRVVRLSESSQ